jgi:hypothetical protein
MADKAAFKLSDQEARDLVVGYVQNKLLELEKEVETTGPNPYPKVGERVRVKLQNIGGVKYTPDNPDAAAWSTTYPMEMRTVVLAVRLGVFLKSGRWGVSAIYWGGMGIGGSSATDRHSLGRAIDIHGADTTAGKLDVLANWGRQPITLPNGKKVHVWPGNIQPYFRLDVDTPAGGFFYDVYHFLTGEARDKIGGLAGSSIGDRSFILCPDMPDAALRARHQDHIHCDVAGDD